jgi:hypothetical protein
MALETIALLAASVVHLLSISLIRDWTGDVCYGPRYMLEAIVLLMPLTLPAFEAVANSRSRRAAIAIGGVVLRNHGAASRRRRIPRDR